MSVDIDHLSLDQLYELNDRVVERINQLEGEQALRAMMALKLGSRVSFDSQYGRQVGTVAKFNRKTVVVLTEDRKWRVSPHLLSPVDDTSDTQHDTGADLKRLK